MHEDAIAIEAIKLGYRDRYGELVDRYERLVYGIAWSRLGNEAFSEDAVQETFVEGFRFLSTLRQPEKFAAWISRIARNIAGGIERRNRQNLAHLRRWQIEQKQVTIGSSDDTAAEQPVAELLGDSLKKLSASHRECLVLFYLKNRSIRESASLIGISENSFKTRLHRARAALRESLEAQLEPALEHLEPTRRSRDSILASLPAGPIGWGGKGLSFSGLLGGVKAVGMSMVGPLLTLLLVNWTNRDMARNYREGGGFRAQLLRRNFIGLVLVVLPTVALSVLLCQRWGSRALYLILGIYMLPTLVQAALTLRVNHTPFVVATAVGTASMAAAFLGMGLLGLPFAFFLVAMLIFNVGLWRGRKSMPMRGDYNLFLRGVTGGFGEPIPEPGPVDPPSAGEMKSFAKFLGQRFLIADYSIRGSGCVLYLPTVRNNVVSSFLFPLARFNGSSTLAILPDGSCKAGLSRRDAQLLRLVAPGAVRDPAHLEEHISKVIGASLHLFRSGNEREAARLLQSESEEDIFVRPPHSMPRMRALLVISIVGTAVALVCFWVSHWIGLLPEK